MGIEAQTHAGVSACVRERERKRERAEKGNGIVMCDI